MVYSIEGRKGNGRILFQGLMDPMRFGFRWTTINSLHVSFGSTCFVTHLGLSLIPENEYHYLTLARISGLEPETLKPSLSRLYSLQRHDCSLASARIECRSRDLNP